MTQNKSVKVKKTEIVKKSSNPVFNESFTFKIAQAALDTANVTITAMQHQVGYKGGAFFCYFYRYTTSFITIRVG